MQASDRKKIEQTISLLQEVLGQKGTSGETTIKNIQIPGFDNEVANFAKLGQQLEPEIKDLTTILLDSIKHMQNILNYSPHAKPPTEQQKNALSEKFISFSKRSENVQKSQNFVYHARSVKQLLSAPYWVLTNSPQYIIKASIESADFNAIKFQKNKNQAHNDWWKSIGRAFRILEDFAKKQYATGPVFNVKGTVSWNDVISGAGGQGQKTQSNPQQQQTQQQQPIQTAPQQQKPQKVPKRQLSGQTWLIANFSNENITFPPGQIEMKHGIFIQNCKDCTITINDKFKSLQLSNFSNITLVTNSCVSGIQIMNGQNINVYVKGMSPSVSVDKCKKVNIILNQDHLNCDIVSSKASELNVTYQKNGNEAKSYMVAEQLITKWNGDKKKFETVIYDKFL